MNYPLDLTFKVLALTGQIYVRDASGSLVAFVKQKFLKLKEDINIFADEQQSQRDARNPSEHPYRQAFDYQLPSHAQRTGSERQPRRQFSSPRHTSNEQQSWPSHHRQSRAPYSTSARDR